MQEQADRPFTHIPYDNVDPDLLRLVVRSNDATLVQSTFGRPFMNSPTVPAASATAIPNSPCTILRTYCTDCHDQTTNEANINFDVSSINWFSRQNADLWEKVLFNSEHGIMPPPNKTELSTHSPREWSCSACSCWAGGCFSSASGSRQSATCLSPWGSCYLVWALRSKSSFENISSA